MNASHRPKTNRLKGLSILETIGAMTLILIAGLLAAPYFPGPAAQPHSASNAAPAWQATLAQTFETLRQKAAQINFDSDFTPNRPTANPPSTPSPAPPAADHLRALRERIESFKLHHQATPPTLADLRSWDLPANETNHRTAASNWAIDSNAGWFYTADSRSYQLLPRNPDGTIARPTH